jgi:hypothetical protein
MIAFPVRREYLRADRRFTVAQATLGLTVYLANGVAWAREGALAALNVFLRHAPEERLRWYSVSTGDQWNPLRSQTFSTLAEALPLPWHRTSPRHLFQLRVVDETSTPTTAFIYRELDEDRAPCAGYIQCVLPFEHPVDDFVTMILGVLGCGLWWSGLAGYLATWSVAEKPTSFTTLRRWCRRYHGLDVQDPDAMMLRVTEGLPGTNWLTAIGKPFMARRELVPEVTLAPAWDEAIEVAALPQGMLVRAGDLPTLGDLNTLDRPVAYAEVAQRLEPYVLASPPDFPWWSVEEKETRRWFHRLARPEEWSE